MVSRTLSWIKRSTTINLTVKSVPHGSQGAKRYTLSTKIEAAELVIKYTHTIRQVSDKLGMTYDTVSKWVREYNEGKYSLDNVVQITRKSVITTSVSILLNELVLLEQELKSKKTAIREALTKEYEENMKKVA